MFKKIKEFFTGKPAAPAVEVPYKVEAPAAVEVSAASMKEELKNPLEVAVEQLSTKPAKAKKAPAAKKAPVAKKPRAPKKPKAE